MGSDNGATAPTVPPVVPCQLMGCQLSHREHAAARTQPNPGTEVSKQQRDRWGPLRRSTGRVGDSPLPSTNPWGTLAKGSRHWEGQAGAGHGALVCSRAKHKARRGGPVQAEPQGKGPSPTAGGVWAGHGSNHCISGQSCLQGLRLKPVIQDLAQEKDSMPGFGGELPQHPGRQERQRVFPQRHCQHTPWRWGL